MLLDFSLNLAYPTRTKRFYFSIFKNYLGYVPGNVYPILEQPILPPTYTPYFVGNQLPIMVQLVISRDQQPIQQLVTAFVPTIVHVTISLPIYVPRGFAH